MRLKYLLLISFLIVIAYSCTDKKEPKKTDDQEVQNDTLQAEIQTDTIGLSVFWKEFKMLALKENYGKLAEISFFPFLNHGSYITKEEFMDIRFPDYILEDIKKSAYPVRSEMVFEEGVDSNGDVVESPFKGGDEEPVFEVDLNGASLYFAKVDEKFVFVGLLYGE
ncbi:MAG TPA: hypothetical protein PLU49_15205 [Saprospiraceae bacterium]|nr:hypothetical protein [Saprospirales bacterium]HRQ31428.1 hypothetical protein [Saprospiraceae bacterium]